MGGDIADIPAVLRTQMRDWDDPVHSYNRMTAWAFASRLQARHGCALHICHACTMHVPCMSMSMYHVPCTMHVPCIYHAYTMHIPCTYHAYTMHVPCIHHAYLATDEISSAAQEAQRDAVLALARVRHSK